MMFRHIYLTIFSVALLTITGSGYAQKNSGCGKGMSADTLQMRGTVESVHLKDSMIVVNTSNGLDIVYYRSTSAFTLGDPLKVLRPDTRIQVTYTTENGKKIANRVEPEAKNKDGSRRDTDNKGTGSMRR
jgi:hypothetical protein